MNRRQLQKLGIPPKFAAAAIDALRTAASQDLGFGLKGKRAKDLIKEVAASPATFVHDPVWGRLASEMLGYARGIDVPSAGSDEEFGRLKGHPPGEGGAAT
ncbi:MAG TPA: hypothetical protein VF175_11590 [Lacipirellula sp.]